MNQPVVVTGASGFVARYVIAELLRRDFAVRGTLRDIDQQSRLRQAFPGIADDRLSFAAADLTRDAGWDHAVAGAHAVIHTASPFPVAQPDNADDVIVPARDGTLRVLRAAADAGVGKVVLTSSTVAVMYGRDQPAGHIYTEADFSDATRTDLTPYIRSKTLAEQAAWAFVNATPGAPPLTVINPAFIQGPALDADLSTSHELYKLMAAGKYPAAPKLVFPVCDVRDVAIAHVEALLNPAAAGQRFIVANGETSLFGLGQRMAALLPDLKSKAPKMELPDAAVRALALFDKRLRTILPELGAHRVCSARRVQSVLGVTPRPAPEAIDAAIRSLRELRII